MPELDLSFAFSKPVRVGAFSHAHLCLVGCGGTGSWLAPAVARVARVLQEQGVVTRVTFVDPDSVEHGNIYRQNFCAAEVGRNKAETLAVRYGQAWGLEIHARPRQFQARELNTRAGWRERQVTVLVGAVDNAAARQELAAALRPCRPDDESVWWLDCGNGKTSGQVLLGSTFESQALAKAFILPDRCHALPAPTLQHPELLTARPEELDPELTGLSCEELAARNAQSLTANQMMAALAADYLSGLLLTRELRTYATYMDLHAKAMKSKPITPEALAPFVTAAQTAEQKAARKRRKKQ